MDVNTARAADASSLGGNVGGRCAAGGQKPFRGRRIEAACDRIFPHAALMIREKCAQLECDGIARRMWADHADIETRGVIPCGLFLWCKLPDAIDAAG